ncbi:MAG: hypothetical protein K1X67_12310 [Fimbriimonadaceae bacterium]|nr:hypothetical protein [Fimbriimonadaceae bacterium]
MFRRATKSELEDFVSVGTAVSRTSEGHHVGLLFREDGEIRFLHFAFHHDLRCDNHIDEKYVWAGCPIVEQGGEILIDPFIAYLNAVKENKSIPYSLMSDPECFMNSGEFIDLGSPFGLTCSTFIAALFQSYGLKVVNLDTWEPRPDDVEVQLRLVGALDDRRIKTGSPDQKFVDAVRDCVGAPRLRPCEIASAVASDVPPLDFDAARLLAEEIIKCLSESEKATES